MLIENKTGNVHRIRRLNIFNQVLERWNNEFPPDITGQKMNKRLQIIGEKLELNRMVIVKEGPTPLFKKLTSKVGRKTFISQLVIAGVPHDIIASITDTSIDVIKKHYAKSYSQEQLDAYTERLNNLR
ncbi:MAG: hypothetical protein R8G66_10200 [Cytophagales bacterium]|nr:hypothetical protein [Cytophagales bacterium]